MPGTASNTKDANGLPLPHHGPSANRTGDEAGIFGGIAVSSTMDKEVSLDSFKVMAELAGLGMTQEELEELKPLYDLYLQYVNQLHSIDFGAEEVAVSFQADWPS